LIMKNTPLSGRFEGVFFMINTGRGLMINIGRGRR